MSVSNFYHAFEDLHRGSRELIGKRLEVYLPFVAPLRELLQPTLAVDLGCGRGEWLELLGQAGFDAHGVDSEPDMVQTCRALGLSVTQGDALEHLRSLGNDSHGVVSGFHIAEHITFEQLQMLVTEALRVLQPGGLLILETPNPENLVVGTSNFWLDPTHKRPIPPSLLSFLPEHEGYQRVKILRLQESGEVANTNEIGLVDVLDGVSPDYSIVAQKSAPLAATALFDAPFSKSYGYQLHDLVRRHDADRAQRNAATDARIGAVEAQPERVAKTQDALLRIETLQLQLGAVLAQIADSNTRIEQAHVQQRESQQRMDEERRGSLQQLDALQRAANASQERLLKHSAEAARALALVEEAEKRQRRTEQQRDEATRRFTDAEARMLAQQARSDEFAQSSHRWWLQAQALENERDALHASMSWRITAPLRRGADLALKYKPARVSKIDSPPMVASARRGAQQRVAAAMGFVLRDEALAYRINQRLLRYPALHGRLLQLARKQGLMPPEPVVADELPELTRTEDGPALTPRENRIYCQLKAEITGRNGC